MSVSNILDTAKSFGIGLFVMDGKLRVEAPKGRLTPELRGEIASHKAEITRLLTGKSTRPAPGPGASTNYFDRIYRRLDRFSGSGRALAWFQDNHPEECAKLTRLYFAAQKDPENKAKTRTWARVELETIRRHRVSVGNIPQLRKDLNNRLSNHCMI